MHSITSKLNKDARVHPNEKGTTFFLKLGEQHYNFKTKQRGWTNYDAAVFASGSQVDFYTNNLRAGAIVTVTGTSLIMEVDEQYGPKLQIQEAKIEFIHNAATPMPDNVREQYQAPPPPSQELLDDDLPF